MVECFPSDLLWPGCLARKFSSAIWGTSSSACNDGEQARQGKPFFWSRPAAHHVHVHVLNSKAIAVEKARVAKTDLDRSTMEYLNCQHLSWLATCKTQWNSISITKQKRKLERGNPPFISYIHLLYSPIINTISIHILIFWWNLQSWSPFWSYVAGRLPSLGWHNSSRCRCWLQHVSNSLLDVAFACVCTMKIDKNRA